MPDKLGNFSGNPRTEWDEERNKPDRTMTVLELFTYTDPEGTVWDAPARSIVDGASIPEPLWALVGSPYTGDYRRASIVHDIACDRADTKAKRKAADKMYYWACRCGGCSKWQATVQYLGVRIGACIPLVNMWAPLNKKAKTQSQIFQQDAAAASIVGTFYEIAGEVEPQLDSLAIQDIESIADRHLSNKAKLKSSAA